MQYVGILLFAAGIAFREGLFGTWQHFIVRVQVREEARLVTWGPYSHIRHPSYTGSWLIYDGNITGGWDLVWALFTLALTLIAYGYRINIEEQALQEAFGSEWDDHKKRTWKRIPGF